MQLPISFIISGIDRREMKSNDKFGQTKKSYCPQCKKMTEHEYKSEDRLKCSECGNINEEG